MFDKFTYQFSPFHSYVFQIHRGICSDFMADSHKRHVPVYNVIRLHSVNIQWLFAAVSSRRRITRTVF